MRVVLTLVVRDEEDILEANLDYHLRRGRRSRPRHRPSLARTGRPRFSSATGARASCASSARRPSSSRSSEWQTRDGAARIRGSRRRLGDPRRRRRVLVAARRVAAGRVRARAGRVRQRPRPPAQLRPPPRRRRVVRRADGRPPRGDGADQRPGDAVSPGREGRCARRAPTSSSAQGGGHQVFGIRGEPLEAWHPVEVLHFPLRSREQCARKYEKTLDGLARRTSAATWRGREQTADADRSDAMWERLALDDAARRSGTSPRALSSTDTRLRDALRALGRRAAPSVVLDRGSDGDQLARAGRSRRRSSSAVSAGSTSSSVVSHALEDRPVRP